MRDQVLALDDVLGADDEAVVALGQEAGHGCRDVGGDALDLGASDDLPRATASPAAASISEPDGSASDVS